MVPPVLATYEVCSFRRLAICTLSGGRHYGPPYCRTIFRLNPFFAPSFPPSFPPFRSTPSFHIISPPFAPVLPAFDRSFVVFLVLLVSSSVFVSFASSSQPHHAVPPGPHPLRPALLSHAPVPFPYSSLTFLSLYPRFALSVPSLFPLSH
jgi:hypothetical protein